MKLVDLWNKESFSGDFDYRNAEPSHWLVYYSYDWMEGYTLTF